MFGLIGKLVGAAVLGAVGYVGYKRFLGTVGEMSCSWGDIPWYLPEPAYGCGVATNHGAIDGMQWYKGEWIYHLSNGQMTKESLLRTTGEKQQLAGAAGVRIL